MSEPKLALEVILSMLPLHTEEGGRREVIPEVELMQALLAKDIPIDTSTALVYTLRRQFESLALLDSSELHRGNWAFVSFPASLLGRSWLTTLATPGQALLKPDYWEQGDDRTENIKDEQRTVLHRLETERVRLNPQAQTIRTVHVAWALIRWGDKFLLHHREDKKRTGENNYVLPGGRFNLSDLPPAIQSSGTILKEIFNPESKVVAQHIAVTLQRELEEEASLLLNTHYTFEPFEQPLSPYKEVNGAGNRHAYSAYQFHLFQINLTAVGETHLLSRISKDTRKLTWFTASEVAAPQRGDGAATYVDVLRQAWGPDLEKILLKVSGSVAPPVFAGESQMLDFPGAPDKSFQRGKPGKEKAVKLDDELVETEWKLLMMLGWHMRGFQIKLSPDTEICLLGNGWIEAPALIPLALSLHRKVQPALPGLVEIREDRFMGLRIEPEILFFAADLFGYKILGHNEVGGKLQLKRHDIPTPWGTLLGVIFDRGINGNTAAALRELEKGDEPQGDWWDRTLREQFGNEVRGIGLRRLWNKGKVASLVEGIQRIS